MTREKVSVLKSGCAIIMERMRLSAAVTSASSAGSVSPRCAATMTSSPRARASRAKRKGSWPLPAMRPIRSTA